MASTAQNHMAPLQPAGDGKAKDEDMEEELEYSPFYGIEKGLVLQEARVFNNSTVDPRRCQQVITKLLYLLTQGESFTKAECADVFFSVTKLFQHRDVHLRRMVYLVIKEFIPSADEVIIITSSLMKDMNSPSDLYRANAIRVLCRIVDPGMLLQIERYLKQAVVDKSPVVAAAVLAGATQLAGAAPANAEVIRRWASEVGEAAASKHPMVQFHAVALQHALRARDRLAVSKLVAQLTRGGAVRSPLAQVLLVRCVAQVMAEGGPPGPDGAARPFYDFLEGCLRHKSEMVIFEAARAICGLRGATARELAPAVTVLQLFLSSSKPVLRFAAVRTLARVAAATPAAVAGCNVDLEALIGDSNRSVATLAITTLLKTGSEASVDRLLKQISGFMGEIADEHKVAVVGAIRALCLKFPGKHRALMAFLAGALREDGGYEFKRAIVDAVLELVHAIPEAKDAGLGHLAEFIEDCEFTALSTRVLGLLGAEGPRAADPARYVRFVYNRVILENAAVRAAALSALARFAAECEALRPRCVVLLRRALHDADDEVRDRAALYLHQLAADPASAVPNWRPPAKGLEAGLAAYLAAGDTSAPFDLDSVPAEAPPTPKKAPKPQGLAAAVSAGLGAGAGAPAALSESQHAAALRAVPELAALGPVWRTLPAQRLTEEETEYRVDLVVHVLEGPHVVLQYLVTNTVAEQVLEAASVAVDLSDAPGLEEAASLPLAAVPGPGEPPGAAYVVLSRGAEGGAFAAGRFANVLRFRVREVDPATGEAEEEGYDDEYRLEDGEVPASGYVRPAPPAAGFRDAWDAAGDEAEVADGYALGPRDALADAVEAVQRSLGLAPCEGSDIVPPNARSHALLLGGVAVGGVPVLARVQFGMDAQRGVAMKLAVRAGTEEAANAIHQIIQEA